ncbi:hypothetical protein [Marinifilum fragile]|uniref:hypothetical protein n=1 Tax=Marinifilum fragile TaxID=570161 RepID=UPI002AAA70BA|nr:hypothetical protein [Marinifilum fragile]
MRVLKNIQNRIKGNLVYGVHLHLKAEGDYRTEVLALKRSGENISVLKEDYIDSLEKLPKNALVSLNLTGTGILTKKLDSDVLENGVDGVLPNGRPEDFIFQSMNLSDQSKILVAIIRKDLLEKLLKEIKEKNLWVIDLHLGITAMQDLLSLIQDVNVVSLPGMHLELHEGKLNSWKRTEENKFDRYRIGSELLDSNQLLPFGAGVSALAVDTDFHLPEMLQQARKESYARKYMMTSQYAFLVLVFVLLLVNFLKFDALNKKHTELSSQLQTGRSLLVKMNQLQSEVDEKEAFFVKSGLRDQTKMSLYSDRIAKLLPSSVRLNCLELNPLSGKVKQGKELRFQNEHMLITGSTNYPVQFNNWIQKLKKEDWVEAIIRQEYYKKDQNKPGEFEVEISITK